MKTSLPLLTDCPREPTLLPIKYPPQASVTTLRFRLLPHPASFAPSPHFSPPPPPSSLSFLSGTPPPFLLHDPSSRGTPVSGSPFANDPSLLGGMRQTAAAPIPPFPLDCKPSGVPITASKSLKNDANGTAAPPCRGFLCLLLQVTLSSSPALAGPQLLHTSEASLPNPLHSPAHSRGRQCTPTAHPAVRTLRRHF